MRTEAQIQQRASKLLKDAGVAEAPINLKKVVAHLAVEVRAEDASDDVSGALYRLPKGAIIGLNARHSSVRQRFTLAHEIGHLVLHELPVFVDRAYAVQSSTSVTEPRFLRNRTSSAATDPAEIEANRFAACLLMPRDLLISDMGKATFPLRAENVAKLADKYQVSTQAMTFRLVHLGIPLEAA